MLKKKIKMRKLNKEILQERSDKINNYEYLILGDYINSSTKIEIRHLVCDRIFEQKPGNHLQGKGCLHCFGNKKSNIEELQEKSNKKHNNTYLIIGEYINNETNILIKHLTCGLEFLTIPINHLRLKGCCHSCFKNVKKTKEQFQEESNKIHNNEYLIIGDYIKTDNKIEIKHLTCGSLFKQTPDHHLRNNRCPICFGKNKLSKKILQERSDLKYNGEYKILGEYVNSSTPIMIRHNNCESEYLQIPNNHLIRKCFNCNGTPKRTIEDIQKISDKIHNYEYEIIGEYITTKDIITIKHKICGKESKIIAHSHINGGKCGYCSISKGEKEIQNIFDTNQVKYEFNKSFDGCVYKNKLRFDFYLPDYNICIEYDGKQHFESIDWFGGKNSFLENQIRDKIKNEWCIENNINLIRISYKDNIEDKLKQIFNI